MATPKEIELCQHMLGLAIQINAQRKVHVSIEFSGHVDWFSVRIVPAPWSAVNDPLDGWSGFESPSYVALSTGFAVDEGECAETVVSDIVAKLEMLSANLHEFLDLDDDGVPV